MSAQQPAPPLQQALQLPVAQQRKFWVRPDQIRTLIAHASPEQISKYENGVKNLLQQLEGHKETDAGYMQVARKITEVSYKLKAEYSKRRQQMMASAPAQAEARPQGNPQPAQGQTDGQAQAQAQGVQAQIAQTVQKHVAEFQFEAPHQLSKEESQKYIAEARNKYGRALQTSEMAKAKITRLSLAGKERQEKGQLTPAETDEIKKKMLVLKGELDNSKAFIEEFRAQQNQLKQARKAFNEASAGQTKTPAPTPAAPAQPGAASATSTQSNANGAPQPPSINTGVSQAGNGNYPQQRSAEPQSATQSGAPRPLSHSAAMAQAAQSYNSVAPATPSVNRGEPVNIGARDLSGANTKLPIPITLPPQNLQAVSVGPSRPTYSGGSSNSAIGMMGQPGRSTQPTYNLGGESERILSKKKLQELWRQVKGPSDGNNNDDLSPEVEEIMYTVADDFIDDVIKLACEHAKLRGSSMLEAKDLMYVITRVYGLPMAGFNSSEIPVVKKVAPTVGWAQKLHAVQASKVSNKGE